MHNHTDHTMQRLTRLFALLLATMTCVSTTHAQRGLKDIPDPDPVKQQATFKVHPEFEVNLFASDPMIAKPIQMNWDARGRLWVATSSTYPHIKPGQKADDKIVVLEDTDGDGKADKSTVFAEGLLIPTAIEPHDTGGHDAAFVANSTELLYLEDTDGDGKADKETVVLSGFGTEDTHHILHTFRWGFDGRLYMNQSIYIHSHIETPRGVKRLNGGGIWRFNPRTLELDVYVRGFVNTWGHHWDDWGAQFATDGAYGDGPNYTFPGAAYVTAVGAARTLRGLAPGNPKHCGLALVTGRHLPESWRGSVITNDFRGNRINRFTLSEAGSGYAARKEADLVSSSHVAFRPIDVKMGPDGAIYIADFYNPIIQHGEVDFRDPRRDHEHGRIWRFKAKNGPLLDQPKLVGASNAALLDALKSEEEWTRNRAKRLLVHRGKDKVLSDLNAWTAKLDRDDAKFERNRLEALWLYQGLDVVNTDLLSDVLNSTQPHARAAAMRVLFYWLPQVSDPMPQLAAGVRDDHARVRLEAVRALGRVPSAEAAELALEALNKPMDRFLDYALWLTVRELQGHWLPALQAGRTSLAQRPDHLAFALKAVGGAGKAGLKSIVDSLKRKDLNAERRFAMLELLAAIGGPNELGLVFEQALTGPKVGLSTEQASAHREQQAALLDMLSQTSRQRNVKPNADLNRLKDLMKVDDVQLRAAAVDAVGAWKVESARAELVALVDPKADWRLRQSALGALARLGGRQSRDTLSQLAAPGKSHWVRMEAAVALSSMSVNDGANAAAAILADLPADVNPGGMLRPILNRKGAADALAGALTNRKVKPDVAKLALRTASSGAQQSPKLAEALRKAGGLTNPKRALNSAQMDAFLKNMVAKADPKRGEAVYRRADLGCIKCHAIGGSGGVVGPDISSLGASAPADYIVDSLLEPNKKIKENYHTTIVETLDGDAIAGVLVRQTDNAVLLRDTEDKLLTIPLGDVDKVRTAAARSLMPEGLTDAMTQKELADLVAFLSRLGKPGDYNVGSARVVRTWKAMLRTLPAQDWLRHHGIEKAAIDHPAFKWTSVYSKVDGTLPVGDAPRVQVYHGGAGGSPFFHFLRATIEVTTAGKVGLAINEPSGVNLWRGEQAIKADKQVTLDLPKGRHVLTFAVDPRRKAGLRVEVIDVPGSGARAAVVNGK